jgi:chromosome segregation ATPase
MSIQGEESAEETNIFFEETVAAKQERSECLRELQEELSKLQQLLKDFESSPQETKEAKDRYEKAFHKFVISHANYMKYGRDAERRELMTDNYNNQRDVKLQLDCMVDVWKSNRERFKNPPSISKFSFTSRESRKSR